MSHNYIDLYGRWHTKPVTDENPLPTNNAYIYSFYAAMVGLPVKFTDPVIRQILFLRSEVLTRHPGVKPPQSVPISHDEYVGIAGLTEGDNGRANRIVAYGERNHWQFCDIPGFNPTPFRKLVINDVLSAYEDLANDEENPRHAVIKYPALHPVAFWHRPEQQYFYYRCAGRSPGPFRTLYFILATLVSILNKDKTSPMLGFKFIKIKKLGPNLAEKALIKLFNRYGKWTSVCEKYFPADHPILEAVLGLKN